MYTNITAHDAKSSGKSCNFLVEYLEKENDNTKEETKFFNQDEHGINKKDVINGIDNNRGVYKLDQSNFYMLNVSPSKAELEHLEKMAEKYLKDNYDLDVNSQKYNLMKDATMKDYMMEYSKSVMKDYAKNFEREINGRPLNENDFLWYGKIETSRKYNHKDLWVLENEKIKKEIKKLSPKDDKEKILILENKLHRDRTTGLVVERGMQKGGLQYHAHIIVSRHDKTNNIAKKKLSLSPMSKGISYKSDLKNAKNAKIGFSRDNFKELNQKSFDELFNFKREISQNYEHMKSQKKMQNQPSEKMIDSLKYQIKNKVENEIKNSLGLNEINLVNKFKMDVSEQLGVNINALKIPKTKVELAKFAIKKGTKIVLGGDGLGY